MSTTKRARWSRSLTIKAKNALLLYAATCGSIPKDLPSVRTSFCGPYMCAGQKKNGNAAAKSNMPGRQIYAAKTLYISTLSAMAMPSAALLTSSAA